MGLNYISQCSEKANSFENLYGTGGGRWKPPDAGLYYQEVEVLWEEGSKSDLEVKVVNKIVEMIKGHTMLVKYFPVPGVLDPPENISSVLL